MKLLITFLNLILMHILAYAGSNEFFLPDGSSRATEKFAVLPLTSYRLSFSAKIDGPGNFEDSPQLEYLFMYHDKAKMGRKMASWKVRFYDPEGKKTQSGHLNFWQCIFSKDFQIYQDEFYTSGTAAFMSVEFSAGERADSLYVKDLSIKEIDNSKTLNLNPEFKLGNHNYSGLRTVSKGQMITGNDAVTRLDLRNGWAVSDLIPVRTGDNLIISISAKGFKKMGAALKFNYCGQDGKALLKDRGDLRIPEGKEKTMSYDFTVPENVFFVEFILGGAVYNWVKLERILNERN